MYGKIRYTYRIRYATVSICISKHTFLHGALLSNIVTALSPKDTRHHCPPRLAMLRRSPLVGNRGGLVSSFTNEVDGHAVGVFQVLIICFGRQTPGSGISGSRARTTFVFGGLAGEGVLACFSAVHLPGTLGHVPSQARHIRWADAPLKSVKSSPFKPCVWKCPLLTCK